ncbi:hypothetical protein [Streptomyces noursei]|uniref:hypothetical protein n=1 Tax=Streptomyces noursei TaxID=1971 RepID=UPI002155377D|nr:hypothetical protein [Streptomyces noursei]
MILDDGSVDFALDRRRHGATATARVLPLPPGVPHDGRTVAVSGFRKRNLCLDDSVLPQRLVGRAVVAPVFSDGLPRHRIHQLHAALDHAGDGFEAESRLSFIRERRHFHLDARQPHAPGREVNRLATVVVPCESCPARSMILRPGNSTRPVEGLSRLADRAGGHRLPGAESIRRLAGAGRGTGIVGVRERITPRAGFKQESEVPPEPQRRRANSRAAVADSTERPESMVSP